MTATSPPTIPVQPPESLSPKSRKGTKLAAAVVGGLVLLGGGFAVGYASGHSPVHGYQQQIATAHHNLTTEQLKLTTQKSLLTTELTKLTIAQQTAQSREATVRSLQRKLQRERRKTPVTASPASAVPVVAFGCKILQTGSGGQEEFNVTTTGGSTYYGTVYVSFYDYPGSGDTFPPTSVQGATPVGSWQPVPAGDIGASAEPSGCIASAG